MVALGDQNESRWGDQNWSRCGDPELEPAWDLICTPGDQKWSGGRGGSQN